MLECQKRQACLRWTAEKCDSFRSIFLFCPPGSPPDPPRPERAPAALNLQSFAERAGWARHLKGRDLLTWTSLDEKSPTHMTQAHSPPQLMCGALQVRRGGFWKWTVSRYNSLWPDFEFIKGISIGFPHLTSNNGAVSLLTEDSPNPWQMLGGAREM